jgi:hypothetical protein
MTLMAVPAPAANLARTTWDAHGCRLAARSCHRDAAEATAARIRRAGTPMPDGRSVMSSTPYVPVGGGETRAFAYDYDDEHGQGLVTFAGVMLMIAAVLNTLYGIAAIDKANFFVHDARYVFGELDTILQMLWIPAYPVLAMTILAFDVIAIYGLLAYGGRRRAAREARARAAR